ncbi:uncharacterized protein [Miscanthus floridulus]|uniref:uncharacterized protein isoform X2 n=1 Tax=Miscanthus floridulus TaxID=154761 RepID=UPI0034589309
MESGGVIAEPSLSSLVVPSQAEESEIMEQLLGTFSNGEEDHQEFPWPIQASNSFYFHCNASASTYSSTSSNGSGSLSLIMPSEHGSYYLSDSCAAPPYLNMVQDQGAALFMDSILNPAYGSCDSSCDDIGDSSMNLLDTIGTSDKRKHLEQGKLDGHTRSRKYAKKSDCKRAKMAMQRENGQSLSSCTFENDSITSQGRPVSDKPGGKNQADCRSATESQSLYARKRRERINERLRILQNLVPNGTKVDISTMLEEAVQYVKFLQLQIKLLSSDEMWMYAPIAYNGMNIGIDLNLSQRR